VRCRKEGHEHGYTGPGSLLDVLQHAGDGATLPGLLYRLVLMIFILRVLGYYRGIRHVLRPEKPASNHACEAALQTSK